MMPGPWQTEALAGGDHRRNGLQLFIRNKQQCNQRQTYNCENGKSRHCCVPIARARVKFVPSTNVNVAEHPKFPEFQFQFPCSKACIIALHDEPMAMGRGWGRCLSLSRRLLFCAVTTEA
jgi:hypothetical protein